MSLQTIYQKLQADFKGSKSSSLAINNCSSVMLLIIGKIHLAKMGQDLKIVLSFAFRLFQENFLNVYLISIHYLSSFWTQDDRIIQMMSDHSQGCWILYCVYSVLSKHEIWSQWKSYLMKYRVALEFYIIWMENIPHAFS